jgi:uncharacterized Zn-binding protein involved in type VI secretion
MAKLSRKDDTNAVGGKIVRGASTVFANGIPVGLNVSDITSHGKDKHKASKTTDGSPSVYAEGVAVLRVGSGTTCGHSITTGSPDVYVP